MTRLTTDELQAIINAAPVGSVTSVPIGLVPSPLGTLHIGEQTLLLGVRGISEVLVEKA